MGAKSSCCRFQFGVFEIGGSGLLHIKIVRLTLNFNRKGTEHRLDLGNLDRIACGNGQELPQGTIKKVHHCGAKLDGNLADFGKQRYGLNIPPLGKASGPLHQVKLWVKNAFGNGMWACAHRNNHSRPEQSQTG